MTDQVHAKLEIMGEIDVMNPHDADMNYEHYPMALLLTFESAEDIRKAIADGTCTFAFE